MQFNVAECQVCGHYIFDIKQLVSFKRTSTGIEPINLKNEQPWVGIICICKVCATTIVGDVP